MIDESPIKEESTSIGNAVLGKTFLWMFLGLIGTGITAWYTYSSGIMLKLIMDNTFWIIAIVELIVVIAFSAGFRKWSPTVVTVLFFLYSMINGLSLSTIFAYFELGSIFNTFFSTAAIFGVLAVVGYKTKVDLSKFGNIFLSMLLAGLILTVINIFIGSSTFAIVLNWIMLAIFFGLVIYDMSKMRVLQEEGTFEEDKIAIYCAMQLYLDFINIFIRILSILGKRRD